MLEAVLRPLRTCRSVGLYSAKEVMAIAEKTLAVRAHAMATATRTGTAMADKFDRPTSARCDHAPGICWPKAAAQATCSRSGDLQHHWLILRC